MSEAYATGEIAILNTGSGFWALDPAGDLKMLFTPNLHRALSPVSEDGDLQRLLKNVDGSWSLVSALHQIIPIKTTLEVVPETNHGDSEAVIIFAELEGGGFISGGAAGPKSERDTIVYRALSELVRHGLAIFHFRNRGTEPKSFYERRLHFFAFDAAGTDLLKSRLSQDGQSRLQIPALAIDMEIPHDLSDLVYVHRCYFKDQPPFVGGDLKRFCL